MPLATIFNYVMKHANFYISGKERRVQSAALTLEVTGRPQVLLNNATRDHCYTTFMECNKLVRFPLSNMFCRRLVLVSDAHVNTYRTARFI